MKRSLLIFHFLASICLLGQTGAWAGQAPGAASDRDIPVPAGSAIVNATGAIRQVVQGDDNGVRRCLVITEDHAEKPGRIVQVQLR
jgi:hypothetical protein